MKAEQEDAQRDMPGRERERRAPAGRRAAEREPRREAQPQQQQEQQQPRTLSAREPRRETPEEPQPKSTPPVDASPPRWSWLVLLMLGILVIASQFGGLGASEELGYHQFLERLARGEIHALRVSEALLEGTYVAPPAAGASTSAESRAQVDESGVDDSATDTSAAEASGTTAVEETGEQSARPDAPPAAARERSFHTVRIEDPELLTRLEQAGVDYQGVRESPLIGLLMTWLLPILLLVFLMRFLLRGLSSQGKSALGFGKSKARLVPESGTGVSFEDVAGCEEAKTDLRQMVEFLRSPDRYTALGARIPKGVLLLGPPGTGKTLLARAVAGEAEVPFFSISGSDFVEMFVGVGAARVRDLFEQAKAKAPCIVFIDEIDAIGRQRGVSMGVVNDEREQTLNQLLSEMDGFEANSGVILLAATNRPEVLDAALLRPGRFDRQVLLDSPDRAGRLAILRVHLRGKPTEPGIDLEAVAASTPGMSGADLANALNEAALGAAQAQRSRLSQRDIEEGIEHAVAGPERRSRRLDERERRRVACHESGHALAASGCEFADPVRKISIVPRGRAALGYTLQVPEAEQYLATQAGLHDRLTVLMAGRAAEELIEGDVSTGAQDDLRVATAIARQMVCLYGMSERLGLPQCARSEGGLYLRDSGGFQRDCSEATAREIDEEVRRILEEAALRARELLLERRPQLERLIEALLESETLDRQAFEALLAEDAEDAGGAGGAGASSVGRRAVDPG